MKPLCLSLSRHHRTDPANCLLAKASHSTAVVQQRHHKKTRGPYRATLGVNTWCTKTYYQVEFTPRNHITVFQIFASYNELMSRTLLLMKNDMSHASRCMCCNTTTEVVAYLCIAACDDRDLYCCGRIIGHFTVHKMVGYIFSGSSIGIIGVSCELLRS